MAKKEMIKRFILHCCQAKVASPTTDLDKSFISNAIFKVHYC